MIRISRFWRKNFFARDDDDDLRKGQPNDFWPLHLGTADAMVMVSSLAV